MVEKRRRRSRLADIKSDWENGEPDPFYIPSRFARCKWSKKKRERYVLANRKAIQKDIREFQDKQREENSKIYAKVKRHNQRKVLRTHRKEKRRDKLADRKARRLIRSRTHEEHNAQVLVALREGDETVGQINKRTELTTKDARRSLVRLVKLGRVTKVNARRYVLAPKKRRRRLSDIE